MRVGSDFVLDAVVRLSTKLILTQTVGRMV